MKWKMLYLQQPDLKVQNFSKGLVKLVEIVSKNR